jgi:hypothetical protein
VSFHSTTNEFGTSSHLASCRPTRLLLIYISIEVGEIVRGAQTFMTTWSSGLGTGLQSPARGFDSRRGLSNIDHASLWEVISVGWRGHADHTFPPPSPGRSSTDRGIFVLQWNFSESRRADYAGHFQFIARCALTALAMERSMSAYRSYENISRPTMTVVISCILPDLCCCR